VGIYPALPFPIPEASSTVIIPQDLHQRNAFVSQVLLLFFQHFD
jgi:hypothetical protein